MFGELIKIDENTVIIKNLTNKVSLQCLNYHVIIPEEDRNIVGEIVDITNETITINLVGEITNNIFTQGLTKKPSVCENIRFLYKSELELLIGHQNDFAGEFEIGESPIYKGYKVNASMKTFFANHFAILGNSGYGKSCGVARIFQNVFKEKNNQVPEKAHILLFDAYGEYNQAFDSLNLTPTLNFKKYTTEFREVNDDEVLKIPLFLLDEDDYTLLLNADSTSQMHVIKKTLKLLYIFNSGHSDLTKYKNEIIAKCIMDILSSGRNSSQIRDQIVAVLTSYNTDELSLNTTISQPGYNRTLRQCLNIDDQGKIAAINLVIDELQKYTKVNSEELVPIFDFNYSLEDFYYALEFALVSEGTINSQSSYESNNLLKNRVLNIINSEYKKYFTMDRYISREDFIKDLFTASNGDNAQLVNINLNNVDDRFAKNIVKIYSRMFFEYSSKLEDRGSFPVHIVLEEAHRYIQEDLDVKLLGYNIFGRICKEGRKYGIILGMITQRPSELTTTVLSQCSNYIVFRIFHPEDLKLIESISINVNHESLRRIKSLSPGNALVFGSAFQLPTFVKLRMPDPSPKSESVDVNKLWY
ncbi:MAG: DUF87 domain-containing protein [Bacilli bacterium]|nr:DUF87 domain-containing protein [Bacilli bacterium]